VFGWFRRDRPRVLITDKGVVYAPSEVEVIDDRDFGTTATSLGMAEAKKRNLELRRSLEALISEPPETVESVLNKFTEAGHDRPEVVITGKRMAKCIDHS